MMNIFGLMMSMKNQMKLLLFIIISCLMMSFYMFLKSIEYWLSFLMVLIYISGIMVLFMFVVSLTPNNIMTPTNKKKNFVWMTILLMASVLSVSSSKNFSTNSIYKMNISMTILLTILILATALIPPKILIFTYKGMKSSK